MWDNISFITDFCFSKLRKEKCADVPYSETTSDSCVENADYSSSSSSENTEYSWRGRSRATTEDLAESRCSPERHARSCFFFGIS